MKNRRISRVLSVFLVIMMVMTSLSFAAEAKPGPGQTYQVNYSSSWNKTMGQLTYYFMEDYFNKDSSVYNSHLATASMALTMAGALYKDDNIKAALHSLGCKDISTQEYGTSGENTVGIALGKKTLSNGKTVIPVVLRGANYKNEWPENFKAGRTGDAVGFANPASKVVSYVKKHAPEGSIIWIMGYSRSAAIANLAAKCLSNYYGRKNVFAYCFDGPKAASPADPSYENIHCVKNAGDGITLVLPEYMNFDTNGKLDNAFGSTESSDLNVMLTKLKTFSKDAGSFASPVNLKWARFSFGIDFSRSTDSIIEEKKLDQDLHTIKPCSKAEPMEFWNEVIDRLQTAIPNRKYYVDSGIQEGLVEAIKLIMSLDSSDIETLKETINDTNTITELVKSNTNIKSALASIQKGQRPSLRNAEYIDIAKLLYDKLFDNSEFTAKQKRWAISALLKLIKPLCIILATDYLSDKQVLGTLLYGDNLKILVQFHYLEVNMAWLMTQDSYYNTGGGGDGSGGGGDIPTPTPTPSPSPKDDPTVDPDPEPVIEIAKTGISKITATKKAFTVKWTKRNKNLTGYQIQYSTKSNFSKNAKMVIVKNKKTTSKKITKLKAKTRYYVRIRCYRTVDETRKYGEWSAAKKIITN